MPESESSDASCQRSRLNAWLITEVIPLERRLRAWLTVRFPGRSDIDDLVQETYSRMLRTPGVMLIRHPKSYLFATARNLTVDRLRRESRNCTESISEISEIIMAQIEESSKSEETEERDRKLDLLAEAIESLPERCREVIILRKQLKMSHEEIAKKLGISKNTVNAQITVGMKKCREYFRNQGLLSDKS